MQILLILIHDPASILQLSAITGQELKYVRYPFKLGEAQMVEAYCVKCRAKRDIKNPTRVTLKNKKPATKGTCPVCGTKVFRIGK